MKPRRPPVKPGPLSQIALRVPADALERAELLVPRLNARPEHQARGAVTRSDVLRLALLRGLEVIARELRQ